MVIEKKLNTEVKTIADASRLMEQNNKRVVDEARYYAQLRRSQRPPLTKPREQAKNNKEPHVIVKGFDVATGKMRAEDKSTGKIFNAKVLSDGPLAVGSRVMGFPPANGESEGYIRGPMKGPPVPPLEIPKKPKKKKEEKVDVLEYELQIFLVTS